MSRVREQLIKFGSKEFRHHPAGSGNPNDDRITELVIDNLPESGRVALIECGTGAIAFYLSTESVAFHSNWIDCEYAKENAPKADHRFEDFAVTSCEETFDWIILRITKSAAHNMKMISKALTMITPTGKVLVAGGNKEGIKGIASKLEDAGVITSVAANGGGGRILEVESGQKFAFTEELINTEYQLGEKTLTVITQEGLFAHGKTDRGTQQLLKKLRTVHGKTVLDLGCGSGIFAKAALELGAAKVICTDISAMALDAARRNLGDDPRVEIVPTYIGDTLEGRIDLILTNPPFHEGTGTTNDLGEEWLEQCKKLVWGKGDVLLVANQFLPYMRWGIERFDSTMELTRDDGFVVYLMRSPIKKKKPVDNRREINEVIFSV